jgi:hypothetical protein
VILSDKSLLKHVKDLAAEGLDHTVEVAFGTNIDADVESLKMLLRLPPTLGLFGLQFSEPEFVCVTCATLGKWDCISETGRLDVQLGKLSIDWK